MVEAASNPAASSFTQQPSPVPEMVTPETESMNTDNDLNVLASESPNQESTLMCDRIYVQF